MKKLLVMMMAVLLTGCSKTVIEEDEMVVNTQEKMTVRFDFNLNETRGLSANGVDMTDLLMYDFLGGEMEQGEHLTPSSAMWDSPAMNLDYGNHSLYFVASAGDGIDEDDAEHKVTWTKVRDTFWATKQLNVTSAASGDVAVTLNRVVTKLKLTITDEVPAGLASVRVTCGDWYYGLDYVSGSATDCVENDVHTVSVPNSYIGTSGQLSIGFFGISDEDEWTTDVTIEALNGSSQVIGSVTIPDVPFKRNRVTEYSGQLFAQGSTFTLTLNDEWEEPEIGTW